MASWLFISLLAALSMIGALSIDAYIPALPAIAAQFSVTNAAAQQSLTLYLVSFSLMTLFYGTLSDSFGRRAVIMVALVLYLFSSIGAALSPNLASLLIFRFLQGLFAGAGSVVGRAMIGDAMTGAAAQRTMAYVSMVFGLAPALAPILGGWLQSELGWRSIFLFISAFTLILLLLCWLALPETLPTSERHPFHPIVIVRQYWAIATHRSFFFCSLGIALSFVLFGIYIGSAPALIMNILHLHVTDFGWLFIPLITGMVLGSWAASRLSHHLSSGMLISAGFGTMALFAVWNVLYCYFLTPSIPWVVLPLFGYAFGLSLANPAMIVGTLELFPLRRGLASSCQSFFFLAVFTVGSGLISPFLSHSAFLLALAGLMGLCLSSLSWWIGTRQSPDLPQSLV